MTTSFDCIATLSESELLDHFTDLVVRDRRTTAELLVAIAEIDERKLWAAHACSSMFVFCMERFHMSEQVTAKRIWAARTARRFPVILGMVERGELNLGTIHLVARYLTDENHAAVLERAKHRSCRQVDRLVAELAPRADVPSRIRALPGERTARAASAASRETSRPGPSGDHGNEEAAARMTPEPRSATKPIVPLSPRRYKIEITVDEATHDKLRSLQDLLGRSGTGRDPAAIISRAIDVLHARALARKAGCTDRPKSSAPMNSAKTTTSATTTSATTTSARSMSTKTTSAKTTQAKTTPATTTPATTMSTKTISAKMTPAMTTPATTTPAKSTTPEKATTPETTTTSSDSNARIATAAVSDDSVAARGRRSRHIPAAVRREVWRRDSGRCCYFDARGRRCGATSNVEFHHKDPFALGGLSTTENVELRCAAHNQFQADLDFGRSFMDAKRGTIAGARAFHAEC